MGISRHIPNTITCMNLLCGCVAVTAACRGAYTTAAVCVVSAAVCDFFDGFAARMLHAMSSIGKDLDSLSDMVSFGVAPALVMFRLLQEAWMTARPDSAPFTAGSCGWWLSAPALLIAVCSALRLAVFNTDPRQTSSFIGLPTPANALFICALSLSRTAGSIFPAAWVQSPWFLMPCTLLCSWLLVSPLPMFSLKFKSFGIKDNLWVYVFLLCSAILLLLAGISGFAAVIVLYILMSGIKAVHSE